MARSTKASGTRQSSREGGRGTTATQLLKKDHDMVKQLFARYEKQGDRAQETKQQIFSEIEGDLEIHSTIEEEIFYPAVQEGVAQSQDLVREALEEHNVVKSLLRELGSMAAADEEFDAKMAVLRENVEHHIQEEEGEMFPKVEQQLGNERLGELGAELQARKETLGQPTIKRIMNGVSGLIFGNGGSKGEEVEEGGEQAERAQQRGGRGGASTRERRGAAQARSTSGRAEMQRSGAAKGERRSAAKAASKGRGAKKRVTGRRSSAQKSATASAKKRESGRSVQAKAAGRHSGARKRGTAASASGRRRTSGKTARKR